MENLMVSYILKQEIEKASIQISRTNPLFRQARKGAVTRKQIVTYLNNLMFIFQSTTANLTRAAKRAQELRMPELVAFLENKVKEEEGHDQWAKNDILAQGAHLPDSGQTLIDERRVTAATFRLLAYVRATIEKSPIFFLSYMAFVEYLTVLIGPELLDSLEKKCGISKSSMTAIANHESLDREHVEEDLGIIDQVSWTPELECEMFEVLSNYIKLVDDVLSECMAESLETVEHAS